MNEIKIGNLTLKSQFSLAPMAGITDYVLRNLIRKYSKNSLLTTEMISSEALIQIQEADILKKDENHSPIAYQLSGHKPELMAKAAKILEKYADIIDINMGCPVNKVVKGQDGCALMRNPKLAADIVKEVKSAINKPLSVKFRLGYTLDEINFVDFGVKMQAAGADFITIHARTRSQMYSGKADWTKIKELKQSVDIPVFANGDVNSIESAIECLEISGADGIALGRGVLGDVTLISRIEHYLNTGKKLSEPSLEEKIQALKEHLNGEIEFRGKDVGIKFVRKFYPYYISGIQNAAKYRGALVVEDDYKKIIKMLDEILLSGLYPYRRLSRSR
ncbi:MAG TPA: tRNA dihydrouridine synthase DusB [Candidatus Gastranaerophilaceae bacterium]|nr:tRNA dihydrouridine synthase DusB [Candidatus Gastranaerophilaceae bacterium]HPT41836.1 tRNA dihydrouridine synthase DusB [Candidatus Gastranaerophilaceae bacterium]